MKISMAVLAAALFAGGTAVVPSSPAEAQVLDSLRQRQSRQAQQQAQQQQRGGCQLTSGPGQRQYQLSREECTAVAPLLQAVQAQNWEAARAAIPAAQAGARSNDGKYVTAQAILHIGVNTNDTALQAQAIDAIIASGGADASELPALYGNQLRLALAAGDTAKAAQAQARLDALNPNDPGRFVRQAQVRLQANDFAAAVPLYLQAIQAAQAAGQQVPVEWRRSLAAAAYQGRDANALRYFREWLNAEPSPNSWHDTLAILAEQGANTGLKLDIYRLMRSAGAMMTERDYVQYAEAAFDAQAFEEVSTVLQEGISRNVITANAAYARERLAQVNDRVGRIRSVYAQDRRDALAGSDAQRAVVIGDRHYGAGEYVQAAEMYRAALQKGGDANSINTRLGAALALAGQRAEAEAALRAVTGPRAEVAQLWLLWLSRRG